MRMTAISMFRFLMLALLLALVPMTMTACSTPQTGVKYSMGKMSAYLDALPPQVIQAAKEAAKELQLHVKSSDATQLDGTFVAETAQGQSLNVKVNVYGDNISAVTIKTGMFMGDEGLSLKFLNTIKDKLADRSRSASPPSTDNLNLLQ